MQLFTRHSGEPHEAQFREVEIDLSLLHPVQLVCQVVLNTLVVAHLEQVCNVEVSIKCLRLEHAQKRPRLV